MITDRRLIHVVDDEEAVRKSLDFLLRTAGYAVERWPDGETFLNKANRFVPACVLLDIRMAGMDGIAVQKTMVQKGLDFPVIVLTGHGDIDLAVQAMKAGAHDFMQKPVDRTKLLTSIVSGFQKTADNKARTTQFRGALAQLGKLTEREREVLEGLACGYPNKTIGFDLGISSRTVEVYRANVMAKLQVTSFAEALRIAFAAGMGSEQDWRRTHMPGPHSGTI